MCRPKALSWSGSGEFDLYRLARSSSPLPAVVFVHGPVPAQAPVRPRDWPVFEGYGRLAAVRGLPIVLTRVGRERPEVQATVDAFLAVAAAVDAAVEVIDVPDGQHGFDALDHVPRSGEAVTEAMDAVHRHVLREGHS
jgi:acetyl esterase/lipase